MQKTSKSLLLLLIVFIFNGNLKAQDEIRTVIPVDTNTKMITYAGAIKEEAVQYELYKRGIEWINLNFKNPADVTRVRDDVNGEIQGVYRLVLETINDKGTHVKTGTVEYNFVLQFKDNKYRYKFTGFFLKDNSKYPLEKFSLTLFVAPIVICIFLRSYMYLGKPISFATFLKGIFTYTSPADRLTFSSTENFFEISINS